ncbi:MAG: ABC transporter permease [Thermoplasmatota archaeon]
MMGHLANIAGKELREMARDPRLLLSMVLVPLLIFPILGGALGSTREASERTVEGATVGFFSLDATDGNGTCAALLHLAIALSNLTVRNITAGDEAAALRCSLEAGDVALVAVPANLTERIAALEQAEVRVYGVLRDFSITESVVHERVLSATQLFGELIISDRLQRAYPNESALNLTLPLTVQSLSVVHGEPREVAPTLVSAAIMGSSVSMPMALMILIIMAGQLAATSVAMEKEQKTLEVLLTLPVRRINILLGKLAGVILVSLLATLSYLFGFSVYFSSVGIGAGEVDLAALGLSPSPAGVALLAGTLLLSFVSALSLAVLLSVFTKDVRSAQSLMALIYIPIMIPAVLLMFSPVSSLPAALQAAVLAIPFSYPIIASQALYTHQYLTPALGLVYQAVFTAAVLALAARIFSTEKILTARVELGRRGRSPPEKL